MPTFKSNRRYSAKRIERMRNGLKRSWEPGGAHHKRFREGPADADTMRKRELWDRKGVRCGSFTTGGVTYQIIHSGRRTDSYDVLGIGSEPVCSGGRAKVGLFLGSLLP